MKKRELKIYGAFRTGSNLVRSLLELNYAALVHNNNYGYKHIPVPADYRYNQYLEFPVAIVTTVKDPLAFLDSVFRYCVKSNYLNIRAGKSFEDFLYKPFIVFDGGFEGFPRYRFTNPIQYWNSMYHHLLSLPEDRNIVVRYEDLLEDLPAEISRIAEKYALERTSEVFVHPTGVTVNMGDQERSSAQDYYRKERFERREYYLDRAYLERYTDAHLDYITNELDPDLVKRLGYPPCSPAKREATAQDSGLARARRQRGMLEEKVAELKRNLDGERKTIGTLQQQVEDGLAQAGELTEARDGALEALRARELELDQERAGAADLRKAVENGNRSIARLEALRDGLEGELDALRAESDHLQNRLHKLEHSSAKALQQRDHAAKELSDSLAVARHQARELDQVCQSLSADVEAARRLLRHRQAQLDQGESAMREVQQELAAVRQGFDAIRNSFSFGLGNDLVNALLKPGKNTVMLPVNVWRRLRDSLSHRRGR